MSLYDTKLRISNIKVSAKIFAARADLVHWCEQEATKKNSSFFIIRQVGCVFTVFYKGHVNISSCRNKDDVERGLFFLQTRPFIFNVELVSIDNITCSARLRQSLFNRRKLRFALYLKEISKFCSPVYYQVKYTPQVFPAAFFKSRHFGTVALFSSGKINIVGCKSFSQIEEALVLFVETIQHASSRIG